MEDEKRPIYFNPLIVVICLVFLAPLGVFLMWKGTGWGKVVKVVVTIASLLFFARVVTAPKPARTAEAPVAQAPAAQIQPAPPSPHAAAEPKREPKPEPMPKASESLAEGADMTYLGDTFTLGKFTYRVIGVEAVKEIRGAGGFVRQKASPDSAYLVVRYEIANNGKETATVMADDFEIVDSQGRKFRPSSEATTAYVMGGGKKDLLVTELQPGITRAEVQLFEIPTSELSTGTTGTKLVIPEKGLLGHRSVTVILATADGKSKVGKQR